MLKKYLVIYMCKYIFIIFRNNNDKTKFEIIVSKINDYRKKVSIIKYNYNKFLKYGGVYREIYSIINTDFSSYCCYRGEFENVEEVRDKLDELNSFYKNNSIVIYNEKQIRRTAHRFKQIHNVSKKRTRQAIYI